MNSPGISEDLLKKIFEQAEREYPSECCGVILSPSARPEKFSRLRPCRNAQDEHHQKDPGNFPRTAAAAYFIEPKELLTLQKEMRQNNETLRVIYHSHIDAGAYFSDEDKRIALAEGEPAYPNVDYLVVSVVKGKVQDANLFHWDPRKKDFVL